MVFNSLTFVLFFAAVLVLHRLPLSWTLRKGNLLLASYLFYAAWNPPFVVLLWISTITAWFVARGLANARSRRRRRALLGVRLGVNLGLLGYFKYAGFLLENFVALAGSLGIDFEPAAPDIILPLGISFYTFQTLSYTISVYRRESAPSRSFLDYALYVTFFPQLVAGPIVRATDFLPQCEEPKRANARQLGWGATLLLFGLFQKMVLADALFAPIADLVFAAPARAGTLGAWVGAFAFSGQIFFDFAGYSSCAIGTALCLGFVIPENFRCPYGSLGFIDFWRRWHVSLSSWLRDYLYISIGGNRAATWRVAANLMFTMLVGGLWHGASWHFVVWGGLHGLYLVLERALRRLTGDLAATRGTALRLAVALATFVVVSLTWIFFRAPSLGAATLLATNLVSGAASPLVPWSLVPWVGVPMLLTFALHWTLRDADLEMRFSSLALPWRAALLAGLVLSILFAPGDDRAFIYFQF